MNRFFTFYTVMLAVFAMVLAYFGHTWYSVFVLCLSFCCYAIILGNELKKTKDVHGR